MNTDTVSEKEREMFIVMPCESCGKVKANCLLYNWAELMHTFSVIVFLCAPGTSRKWAICICLVKHISMLLNLKARLMWTKPKSSNASPGSGIRCSPAQITSGGEHTAILFLQANMQSYLIGLEGSYRVSHHWQKGRNCKLTNLASASWVKQRLK